MALGRILICGDSFSADWTRKYPDTSGWPTLLAKKYAVTNLSQAGCSEYRIYKQLVGHVDRNYDAIIVSHTSPYRIYINNHPVHTGDALHSNSDLIYTDLKEHSKTYPKLSSLVDYFENWFDLDYAKFTHNLICEKIESIVESTGIPHLHLTNLDWDDLYGFKNMLNFNKLFKQEPGRINHYSDAGNRQIFSEIDSYLDKIMP